MQSARVVQTSVGVMRDGNASDLTLDVATIDRESSRSAPAISLQGENSGGVFRKLGRVTRGMAKCRMKIARLQN